MITDTDRSREAFITGAAAGSFTDLDLTFDVRKRVIQQVLGLAAEAGLHATPYRPGIDQARIAQAIGDPGSIVRRIHTSFGDDHDEDITSWSTRAVLAVLTGDTGRASVLAEVAAERERQNTKWGEQNHRDGTGAATAKGAADEARRSCEQAFERGHGTWAHILYEEVWEAFAEDDPARLRAELVQVAAVATQWIQAIDRRTTRHEAADRG